MRSTLVLAAVILVGVRVEIVFFWKASSTAVPWFSPRWAIDPMADDATTAAVSTASHRISLPAFIARPGFVAKEPLREGPPLEPAALVARLEQLLHSDPALFLERYGQWLLQEELAPFEGGGYECTWHLARLRRSTQQREQERRNRRFHAMAIMLRGEGSHADYFSLERMQAWDDAPDCSHATRYVHAPRHATPRTPPSGVPASCVAGASAGAVPPSPGHRRRGTRVGIARCDVAAAARVCMAARPRAR